MNNKVCTLCLKEKPVSDFYTDNGYARSRCKLCFVLNRKSVGKEKLKEQRIGIKTRNKRYIRDYLTGHPCVDCGETNPVVLEFDHVNGNKLGNVGKMACDRVAIKTLEKEINKCAVRCANCHRIKTAKEHYCDWGVAE